MVGETKAWDAEERTAFLVQAIGFGFMFAWIWMGLYEGYPCFRSGRIDSLAVIFLFSGFTVALLLVGFSATVRSKMPEVGVLAAGVATALVSAACVIGQGFLGFEIQGSVLVHWAVRILCFMMGAGTASLLLGFGVRSSRQQPKMSLLSFCAAFAVAFFAFFAVQSLKYPVSGVAFSLFPIISALCLWERVIPLPKAQEFVCQEYGVQEAPGEGTSYANCGFGLGSPCAKTKRDNKRLHVARGFVQMAVAFWVFTFAASLTQSFEPQKDFSLGVEEGWVGFFLVLVLVSWLLISRRAGTFKILKVMYQVAIVLMVLKLVLQPLLYDDSSFAALNVMTWLILFCVFWQLTAFVGHAGEVRPATAFALVFGIAAACMGMAWGIGVYLHVLFGRDRLYISIATGCIIAVFCTFGFSVRSFPYLIRGGKGYHRAEAGADKASNEVSDGAVVTAYPSLDEVISSLADEYLLTPREVEVLGMLAKGKTTEEIADAFVISYYTVRTHIRNLYKKLGVSSRSELLLTISEREREGSSVQTR